MAYFEPVPTEIGLNHLPDNPCKLLDFQLLNLEAGQKHEATISGREVLAVILGGKADFSVNDTIFASVGGRPNVFAGKPHAVYIPNGASYIITALGQVQIGLCSAPSDLQTDPYVISPDQVTSGVWGAANFSRSFHQILTATSQPSLPVAHLIVGETYTPSGNWSTYPPHKHEEDNLPHEAYHEEMYYFKVNPAEGFGMTRFTNADGDAGYIVQNDTILMMPNGYHTVVSAPGYTTYYLWFLAGNHRVQAVVEEPNVGWVSRTVTMLKELGH